MHVHYAVYTVLHQQHGEMRRDHDSCGILCICVYTRDERILYINAATTTGERRRRVR